LAFAAVVFLFASIAAIRQWRAAHHFAAEFFSPIRSALSAVGFLAIATRL
jgi:hypothetical protein